MLKLWFENNDSTGYKRLDFHTFKNKCCILCAFIERSGNALPPLPFFHKVLFSLIKRFHVSKKYNRYRFLVFLSNAFDFFVIISLSLYIIIYIYWSKSIIFCLFSYKNIIVLLFGLQYETFIGFFSYWIWISFSYLHGVLYILFLWNSIIKNFTPMIIFLFWCI